MLVLTRGPKDKILFPNLGISVEILRVSGNRVRIGVDAPPDVRILRNELADSLNAELQQEAPKSSTNSSQHQLRNRLNTAHVALSLAQKQLDAGHNEAAMETLQRAMRVFDALDASLKSQSNEPVSEGNLNSPVRRALLVEDDANECELLAGYLRMSGFQVDTAGDGLQAMVYLSRHEQPDVVLMDMHMPRFDGRRAVKSIRSNPDYKDMRVFAVTGSRPEDTNLEVGTHGVNGWFRKPVDPGKLVEKINQDIDTQQDLVATN